MTPDARDELIWIVGMNGRPDDPDTTWALVHLLGVAADRVEQFVDLRVSQGGDTGSALAELNGVFTEETGELRVRWLRGVVHRLSPMLDYATDQLSEGTPDP